MRCSYEALTKLAARVEAGMAEGAAAWATEGEPDRRTTPLAITIVMRCSDGVLMEGAPDSSGFPPNCYGVSRWGRIFRTVIVVLV